MTPQEAIQLLDQLTAQIQLSRNDHAKVEEALKILAEAVTKNTEK